MKPNNNKRVIIRKVIKVLFLMAFICIYSANNILCKDEGKNINFH